jgi:hypothetical protein
MTTFDQPFTRGMIIGETSVVSFQWNPYQYHIHKTAKWAHLHAAGREQPILQYGCGEAETFMLDLYISEGDRGPGWVKSQTDALLALTHPISGSGMLESPPICTFISGAAVSSFKCVIEDVKIVWETIFYPDTLLPKYAKATIKLTEYK